MLTAFVTSGLIHSDIHLGNLVQELGSDGAVSFALFDVGQFERVSAGEVRALLWALSWISTPERQHSLRHVAMAHLVQHSSLDVLGGLDGAADRGEAKAAPPADAAPLVEAAPPAAPQTIEARILRAFDGAIAPDKDGVRPDKKTAWILFLRNASRESVVLPKGSFAVAKMLDGVISQQESYDLEEVFDDIVEDYLRSGATVREFASVGWRSLLYKARGAPPAGPPKQESSAT